MSDLPREELEQARRELEAEHPDRTFTTDQVENALRALIAEGKVRHCTVCDKYLADVNWDAHLARHGEPPARPFLVSVRPRR